jgi:AraC-like DNA-binding protein
MDSNPSWPNTRLLFPPYDRFIDPAEVTHCPDRGVAAVWFVRNAAAQEKERGWLENRPAGVELVMVLPAPSAIRSVLPLLTDVGRLHPRGILPDGELANAESLRRLLGTAPNDLVATVVAHLTRSGVLREHNIRLLVGKIFEHAADISSISRLARKLYTSRRTLGRYFESQGLPVPSHWLQFARLLHASVLIQEHQELPIFKVALRLGYPDGFTMSNQMKRMIGCRPSEVRENLGYEWIVEEWLKREHSAGRLHAQWPGIYADDVKNWLALRPADSCSD